MNQTYEARRRQPDEAERILRARLSSGEIGEAEYRERTAILARTGVRRRASTGPRVPGTTMLAAAGFVLFAVIFLGAAGGWSMMDGHMGGSAGTTSPPILGAPELAVEAGDMWFRPATLEIQAGQPVNVALTNTGSVFHDFKIDGLDFRLTADRGDAITGGLQIENPGEYRYYCSVPGHAAAGMTGTLTVVGGAQG